MGFTTGSPLRSASYNLTLVIIGLYDELVKIPINTPELAEVFIPLDSMLASKSQCSPPSFGPPGTTFELDCGYHLHIFYENI